MSIRDRLHGPLVLARLSASYVLRRPASAIAGLRGLPAALGVVVVPGSAAWSTVLATTGAVTAFRIGLRVRSAPILRPSPELLVEPDELVPVCSLVSDTHVTAREQPPCELEVDPAQWPGRELPTSRAITDALRRVLVDIAAHAPRTVVWCGDEVDTGDAAEWQAWHATVASVAGLAHRIVPGNHDICFNRPYDEDHALWRRAQREREFQAHAERLADYPVVDTLVTDAGPITLVLLDSCRNRSTHLLSNAIGRFGDDQLAELARILDGRHGPVLCIAHHHVWRDERFLQPDAWYNTAVDADAFVAILRRYRRRAARNRVLVCHGHRHVLSAGVVGDPGSEIAIVGLPSSTLGDKSTTNVLDGRVRYAVAGLRRDGRWGVTIRDVGALVTGAR